jgi:hypothetical protein
MKLLRVRKMGREKVLVVPKELAKSLHAQYMAIRLEESGRLIYTPIPEVA